VADALRPALHVSADGELIVAWHGPLGPAVARFDAWSRERPVFARTLGTAGADRPSVPAIASIGEDLAVFWCEEDGAHGHLLGPDGEEKRARLLVPDALAVAAVAGRERATIFCADEAGIVRLDVGAELAPAGEISRCVSEKRAGALLVAAPLREHALLAFAHRGAPGFGVVLARAKDEVVVRHETVARKDALVKGYGSDFVEDLDVCSAAGRAAIAVELGGGKVYTGEIGPAGQLVERPHALFPRERASLGSPRVVWTEDSFTALCREREDGRLRVQPLGEKGEAFVLPRSEAAFSAVFIRQHFWALEATPSHEGVELRLWRVKRSGAEAQQRVAQVVLDDAAARRDRLALREVLASVSRRIEQARGYRDAGTRTALAYDGTRLELHDAHGRLVVGARAHEQEQRFALCVTSEIGGESALPEATSSMVRLARRVRALFTKTPEAAPEDLAWAEELVSRLEARVLRFERAGAVVVLELAVSALPGAEPLERWLRLVREEQLRRFAPAVPA
jgi:hypothetical protein